MAEIQELSDDEYAGEFSDEQNDSPHEIVESDIDEEEEAKLLEALEKELEEKELEDKKEEELVQIEKELGLDKVRKRTCKVLMQIRRSEQNRKNLQAKRDRDAQQAQLHHYQAAVKTEKRRRQRADITAEIFKKNPRSFVDSSYILPCCLETTELPLTKHKLWVHYTQYCQRMRPIFGVRLFALQKWICFQKHGQQKKWWGPMDDVYSKLPDGLSMEEERKIKERNISATKIRSAYHTQIYSSELGMHKRKEVPISPAERDQYKDIAGYLPGAYVILQDDRGKTFQDEITQVLYNPLHLEIISITIAVEKWTFKWLFDNEWIPTKRYDELVYVILNLHCESGKKIKRLSELAPSRARNGIYTTRKFECTGIERFREEQKQLEQVISALFKESIDLYFEQLEKAERYWAQICKDKKDLWLKMEAYLDSFRDRILDLCQKAEKGFDTNLYHTFQWTDEHSNKKPFNMHFLDHICLKERGIDLRPNVFLQKRSAPIFTKKYANDVHSFEKDMIEKFEIVYDELSKRICIPLSDVEKMTQNILNTQLNRLRNSGFGKFFYVCIGSVEPEAHIFWINEKTKNRYFKVYYPYYAFNYISAYGEFCTVKHCSDIYYNQIIHLPGLRVWDRLVKYLFGKFGNMIFYNITVFLHLPNEYMTSDGAIACCPQMQSDSEINVTYHSCIETDLFKCTDLKWVLIEKNEINNSYPRIQIQEKKGSPQLKYPFVSDIQTVAKLEDSHEKLHPFVDFSNFDASTVNLPYNSNIPRVIGPRTVVLKLQTVKLGNKEFRCFNPKMGMKPLYKKQTTLEPWLSLGTYGEQDRIVDENLSVFSRFWRVNFKSNEFNDTDSDAYDFFSDLFD